jgi:hypothetical protein
MSRRLNNLALGFTLLAASPVGALTPAEEAQCQSVQTNELIDAPIHRLVRAGQSFSSTGKPRELNPLPYRSVVEFKSKNPDCCQILPQIPGDYPLQIQRLGTPYENPPRVYAIRLHYLENSARGPVDKYKTYLVSCLSEVGTETQLLKRFEE